MSPGCMWAGVQGWLVMHMMCGKHRVDAWNWPILCDSGWPIPRMYVRHISVCQFRMYVHYIFHNLPSKDLKYAAYIPGTCRHSVAHISTIRQQWNLVQAACEHKAFGAADDPGEANSAFFGSLRCLGCVDCWVCTPVLLTRPGAAPGKSHLPTVAALATGNHFKWSGE
eukprot:428871-Pelagomonas_calceolata.AAC.3